MDASCFFQQQGRCRFQYEVGRIMIEGYVYKTIIDLCKRKGIDPYIANTIAMESQSKYDQGRFAKVKAGKLILDSVKEAVKAHKKAVL